MSHTNWLRVFLSVICLLGISTSCMRRPGVADLVEGYVEMWVKFYPTRAFAAGHAPSALRFEDYSEKRVEHWIKYNRIAVNTLQGLDENLSQQELIDIRLLIRRGKMELARWEEDQILQTAPAFYAGQISQALTHLLVRDQLTPEEKVRALSTRLQGIRQLCDLGLTFLNDGRPEMTRSAVRTLSATAKFYKEKLPALAAQWGEGGESLQEECARTGEKITLLAEHIENRVLPNITMTDHWGEDLYANRLPVYTAMEDLNPDTLAEMALEEIETTRNLMAEEAQKWLSENASEGKGDEANALQQAIAAMEQDRLPTAAAFLTYYEDLTNAAETFVRNEKIATIPEPTTLQIHLSPAHFSGAAVGGVYAAGPFGPDADTLFYLPTVSDTADETVKEGFYRAFNNHFNTMIIAHEMFPGHYLQLKVASRHPSKTRTLFSVGVNVEGWGSFCEELMLTAGFAENNRLTYLAHLRKRLENAVRAYTSVMVHCKGWTKDQVTEFAVERGLLAPQFAINLWGRLMGSPQQLTTYFLGFRSFSELYQSEQARLGENFSLLRFSDVVLSAGGVPMDVLPEILRQETP